MPDLDEPGELGDGGQPDHVHGEPRGADQWRDAGVRAVLAQLHHDHRVHRHRHLVVRISVSGGSPWCPGNTVYLAGQPVSGKTAYGIYLSNRPGGQVSGNITHDNSAHGIYLAGSTTGVRLSGNGSYHNAYQYQRNANGISVTAPGNTIVGNVTYANEDSGINIYGGNNSWSRTT